jgi:hypothetical protein
MEFELLPGEQLLLEKVPFGQSGELYLTNKRLFRTEMMRGFPARFSQSIYFQDVTGLEIKKGLPLIGRPTILLSFTTPTGLSKTARFKIQEHALGPGADAFGVHAEIDAVWHQSRRK